MSYKNSYRLFRLINALQKWIDRRFTIFGKAIITCLFISAIVGIDTKLTMAYQVFSFLLAILIVSILFSFRFIARFKVTRSLPRFGTVGVKLQYSILIKNQTNKIQTGLNIKETFANDYPSYPEFKKEISLNKYRFTSLSYLYYRWCKLVFYKRKATGKTCEIPDIRANSKIKVVMEIEPKRRGLVELTGIVIARSDPLAIFNVCKNIALKQSLLILPKRYHVPQFEIMGSKKTQAGSKSLASTVGDSEEFISLRDYRSGDPLRKIHWRSWAKTGNPIVKEEKEQFFVRHALILDNFYSSQHSEIFEEAVSIAASFTCDFQTQESLLDLMFVADQAYCFTAGRGLGTTEKMLEILASVTTCQDQSFASLTATVINRISLLSGCICILLQWDEVRKNLIRTLHKFNIPTLVLVITEQEESIYDFDLGKIHSLQLGKIQEDLFELGT